MKILVAEDNAVTATLMTGVLTRHGYTVVLARNGSEALSLLGSDPGIQGVITDIMMPESSGLDLLRVLREHEAWRNLPTIVTSMRDDPKTVAAAVALGCKEYILKPVRPARLIARVDKVFQRNKAILMSSAEVISRYSLSLETYLRFAKDFALLVEQAMAALQSGETRPAPGREDFTPIMESATLLGAERLVAAMEESAAAADPARLTPLQVARLLEELQILQQTLSSQSG